MASNILDFYFRAKDQFSGVMKKMNKSVTLFGKKNDEVSYKARLNAERLTSGYKSMIKQAILMGGLTLGASLIGQAAFKQVADFETALVGVGKTTNTEGAKLAKLGSDIVDLSDKMKAVKTNKLLEFAQAAGQLGVTGNKEILKFSETLAKLETATDIRGEEGAAQIARLLSITKEGKETVDQFGSALVALGNTTAATESEILSVGLEVGKTTSQFGLATNQILGISAALREMGVAPEAAGSAVGKVFRSIEEAVFTGGKKLTRFSKITGLSGREIREAYAKDKVALFSKFVEGLGKINDKGKSVASAMKKVGLSGEIVQKGIIPLSTNSELLAKKLKLSAEEYAKNEALNKEYETALYTLNNALKSITVGFSNFITKFANEKNNKSMVVMKDLLFFIGRNMDTIIPIVSALGAAIGLYKIGVLAATIAQTGLNIAMSLNPIGLIIVGIAALIGFIAAVITHWDEWGSTLTFFMGPLGIVINLVKALVDNWDDIINTFKSEGMIAGIKKIGLTIFTAILKPTQKAVEWLGELTGIDFISRAAENMEIMRMQIENLDAPADTAAQAAKKSMEESNVNVNVNNNNGSDVTVQSSPNIQPTVSSSFSY